MYILNKKECNLFLEAVELVNNEGFYADTQQIIFDYITGNNDNMTLNIYAILILAKEILNKGCYTRTDRFDILIEKMKIVYRS